MSTMTNLDEALNEAWSKVRNRRPKKDLTKIECGVYTDMDFEEYVSIDAINFSSLRTAKTSLLHYRYRPTSEPTPYFRLGTLVHAGKLEPKKLKDLYIVVPEADLVRQVGNDPKTKKPYAAPKRTKKYAELVEAFLKGHPGKAAVTQDMLESLIGSLKSLARNARAKRIFTKGVPEVTIVWEEIHYGITLRMKCRIDWLRGTIRKPDGICDLKTTGFLGTFSPDTYDYHMQGAFYRRGYRTAWPKRLCLPPELTVVESNTPHACVSAPFGESALSQGEEEIEFLLGRIALAIKARKWPGPVNPDYWVLSKWYDKDRYHKHYNYK